MAQLGVLSGPPRYAKVLLLAQESLSRFSWPIMLKLVCGKGVHLVLLLLGFVVFQPVKKRYGSIFLFVIRNRQCWREHQRYLNMKYFIEDWLYIILNIHTYTHTYLHAYLHILTYIHTLIY